MARLSKIFLMFLWCVAVLIPMAHAGKYTITFRDYPGADDTMVGDIASSVGNGFTFGTYGSFATQVYHGFFHVAENFYFTADIPNATATWIYGANDSWQYVGEYKNLLGGSHGYLAQLGQTGITTLDVPGAQSGTYARGINATGVVVGFYDYQPLGSPRIRSFVYDGRNYATFEVPDAMETKAWGINDVRQVVGFFNDGSNHGFLYGKGNFSTLNFPGAAHTFAQGINNAGQIVGSYTAGGLSHGFVYANGNYEPLNIPGATQTWALGLNEDGQVVGTCLISNHYRGFVATPVPVPKTGSNIPLLLLFD